MTDLKTEAQALKRWAIDAALPFWAENGRDQNGGFYEDLDLQNQPLTQSIRRVRVQARQIYVYAMATEKGWFEGTKLIRDTFDFMCKYGLSPDGKDGFVHRINPDYSIFSARRDFYDHAFYLLSCAWMHRLTKDPRAMQVADHIQTLLSTQMKSETSGWLECVPAAEEDQFPRRQNPHMHFLEASMALYDATGKALHLNHSKIVFELFSKHFYGKDPVFIREFFNDDWTPVKGALGATAEPGHAAEWVWLLWEFEKRTGLSTKAPAQALYQSGLRPDIFLNDEEERGGDIRRATKRLWVQTELIKSHLAQLERGDVGAGQRAANTIKAFRETYLQADGTWIDQINAQGQPCAKTIPVSSFYHILCMISEADRLTA